MVKLAVRKRNQMLVSMSWSPLFLNWPAERDSDHLLGAACPADVLAWLLDGNRQVVAAPVAVRGRAGRTTPNPIASDLPLHSNIVEDSKFLDWRREVTLGRFGPL